MLNHLKTILAGRGKAASAETAPAPAPDGEAQETAQAEVPAKTRIQAAREEQEGSPEARAKALKRAANKAEFEALMAEKGTFLNIKDANAEITRLRAENKSLLNQVDRLEAESTTVAAKAAEMTAAQGVPPSVLASLRMDSGTSTGNTDRAALVAKYNQIKDPEARAAFWKQHLSN